MARTNLLIILLILASCALVSTGKPVRTGNLTCHPIPGVHGIIECEVDGREIEYENKEDEVLPVTDPLWPVYFGTVVFITCASGLMSGLTLGLMGLDEINLEILTKTGTTQQKIYAKRILPLVRRHHLLLVTLLLMNAVCMESLPIFLERLVPPVFAVFISVSLILFFGEVIPQSICVRYGLAIGANLHWLVWVIIFVSFPVSWPISKLLDVILGADHASLFKRSELKELISMHGKKIKSKAFQNKDSDEESHASGEELTYDEITIIRGALDMRTKTAKYCLTPLAECFMLDLHGQMDRSTVELIVSEGHSRVPVYQDHKEHVIGMLLVKSLLLIDPDEVRPISKLFIHRMPHVTADTPLYTILHIFQTAKIHMALVVNESDRLTPLGIITLEDLMEELIQEEIEDEKDLRKSSTLSMDEDDDSLLLDQF